MPIKDFATFNSALYDGITKVAYDRCAAAQDMLSRARDSEMPVYFIGNGGSAAIASHMAIDYANKAGFITNSLNDPAALTCLANDYGYDEVYIRQLRLLPAGVLVAISSRGVSRNILNAIDGRRENEVIALTGFAPDNDLMASRAAVKIHVPSYHYAIVETVHLAILHAILEQLRP